MKALASPSFEVMISLTWLYSMFLLMDLTASLEKSLATMVFTSGISLAYLTALKPVADKASKMEMYGLISMLVSISSASNFLFFSNFFFSVGSPYSSDQALMEALDKSLLNCWIGL
ncbi:hypothetical protein WICPIJ_007699 [Wickerhamomyces pijperi]|uniref:Uncharacterized protein n=1 Tax=Wickerhamomyces pijperi TaxID=599730 RepID=A0A9P8TJP2_WICPI|nr:hypothetical protein WICPIJ_007699 [Wickerhamomyces pijperi]